MGGATIAADTESEAFGHDKQPCECDWEFGEGGSRGAFAIDLASVSSKGEIESKKMDMREKVEEAMKCWAWRSID